MQQLIYFFQKYKVFLFFLLLEFIAIALTINNYNFHKSKIVGSANFVTGGMLKTYSDFSDYLHLKSQNKDLVQENVYLKNLVEKIRFSNDSIIENTVVDSLYRQKFKYLKAKIINNNYSNQFNFITIDKGEGNGVAKEMGVVNGKGIIGIVDYATNKYARVQSILNKNSKINARFKNSSHFGTLTWDGKDYNIVQLTDIPRQAVYKKGDTIITGGKSTIFPEGINIGTIVKVPAQNTASNTLDIKLFNDMSNINYVYVINNLEKEEIKSVENITNE
ncbi:rod shape-determining protein MreC [Tenacibaculum sp. UWU-22]|uniref:rod shape-determining protein MreC n=1 Tax=Tenacibaculum sp. UWU-22 TaxID=3234187 RepID=UPI0034DB3A02